RAVPLMSVGCRARFSAADGHTFDGEVARISATVDPITRTTRARILVPNPDLRLRPGLFGDVYLEAEAIEGTLVPRDAVIEAGESDYVIVARGGGRVSPRAGSVLGRSWGRKA